MDIRDVAPLTLAASPEPGAPSLDDRGAPGRGGAAVPGGVSIGRLVGFADDGRTPLVLPPAPHDLVARRARSAIDLHAAHVGRELVLAYESGDASRPIVLALLRDPVADSPRPVAAPADPWRLEVDGERCILSARHELVLECGRARLVLRADGRAELHGETVLTEATGANKVRGGSVQLN